MKAFDLANLQRQHAASDEPYLEFLKEPSLSMGIYNLPAGASDPQQPHSEDEVYYVISGHATIRVADEDKVISPGSIVFVAAEIGHYFHSIEEDLSLLVFFASNAS